MATITPTTSFAADEAACRASPATIEDMFLIVAQDLHKLMQAQTQLDEALPASLGFHRLMRFVETVEGRITGSLAAIRSLPPLTAVERHLRHVARDLSIALALEDGEDAVYFMDTLEAWPDLLVLSDDVDGAPHANALVQLCLDQVWEHHRRCVPAMLTLRTLPDAGPEDTGAPALH